MDRKNSPLVVAQTERSEELFPMMNIITKNKDIGINENDLSIYKLAKKYGIRIPDWTTIKIIRDGHANTTEETTQWPNSDDISKEQSLMEENLTPNIDDTSATTHRIEDKNFEEFFEKLSLMKQQIEELHMKPDNDEDNDLEYDDISNISIKPGEKVKTSDAASGKGGSDYVDWKNDQSAIVREKANEYNEHSRGNLGSIYMHNKQLEQTPPPRAVAPGWQPTQEWHPPPEHRNIRKVHVGLILGVVLIVTFLFAVICRKMKTIRNPRLEARRGQAAAPVLPSAPNIDTDDGGFGNRPYITMDLALPEDCSEPPFRPETPPPPYPGTPPGNSVYVNPLENIKSGKSSMFSPRRVVDDVSPSRANLEYPPPYPGN